MVDLTHKGAHEYWYDYQDPMIYRVLTFMESVEDWTLDGTKATEEALQKLGDALDEIGGIELKEEDKFIAIAAYIKATRHLRLLQALDSANPGTASKLLLYAETKSRSADDVPGLFLRRNAVFERLRLLSRVFSPERLATILKVLEE